MEVSKNGRVTNMALSWEDYLHEYITCQILLPRGWDECLVNS